MICLACYADELVRAHEPGAEQGVRPRQGTSRTLDERCAPELGAFTGYGPVDIVREAVYFQRLDGELQEFLDGAYIHSDRDTDFGGNGTSEFVVDVFDAPIPAADLGE
ncbi:hypothetical protein [Streptomyces lavenduligriseus]|uniref:Uncharacterized protein n=1 Tax=Streptomyces lavenduligriseus TaxID=67315 RepID=A0ABT0P1I1_9ACTN|nr:hypothetical protein [Streptomyces lavenduligriseus]MCL3997589.1 hypothetical protein [Streptomyces lavenduligriseus]